MEPSHLVPLAAQKYGNHDRRTRLVAEIVVERGGAVSELAVMGALETVTSDFRHCCDLTDDGYRTHIEWALGAQFDD
ncbi:MAG TPA: hypothetical protein VHH13_09115 [Arthrobacter sp.]|nr:hypothetical protein [Arthrobacter sp.]